MDATKQRIERMETAVNYVAEAIAHGEAALTMLDNRLAELGGITCTGLPFWRDKDHPTRQPKFYANHGVNECCPLHGKPEKDKRLRVYVGTDIHLITLAKKAMHMETERQALESQRRIARNRIRNAERHLTSLFTALEWKVDEKGHAELSDKPLPRRW